MSELPPPENSGDFKVQYKLEGSDAIHTCRAWWDKEGWLFFDDPECCFTLPENRPEVIFWSFDPDYTKIRGKGFDV